MSEDDLWWEAERQTEQSGHCKGKAPVEAMTRLFGEHFGKKQRPPFDVSREACTILKATWPIERLRTLQFETTDEEPSGMGKPLIAVETSEKGYLIDGRRRLNKAIREGSPSHLQLLLITEKQP